MPTSAYNQTIMMRTDKFWFLGLVLLVAVLAACAQNEEQVTATATTTLPAPTETPPTPTETPTPRPTATATATPLLPAVTAIEQAVDEAGTIMISNATLPEAGWVVVYSDEDGEPGEVLGYAPAGPGSSTDIPVTIDPYLATDTLHVRLHENAGEVGEFEFPGPDEPVAPEETATATFAVDIRIPVPAIAVSDQEVGDEQGQVAVDAVTAPRPGWVVLYADAAGERGEVLGQTPVDEGDSENVVVDFDWRQATGILHVVLHEDAGAPGRFEPAEADEPFVVGGEPVAASFEATLPVDVFVINQPASSGEVYVERALTNVPGWLAVYTDFVGLTDRLLGYVPLEPGANEDLVVPISGGGITSRLHIMVHEDAGMVGEFEFPGPDRPLLREGRMQLFSFQTDAGNYLETRDQVLSGDEATIPLVVADLDVWLVIHADEEGELGERIGRVLLEPGVHQAVTVPVDTEAATPILHAALYQDAEPLGEFEPDGSDEPLRFGDDLTQAPFAVESGD